MPGGHAPPLDVILSWPKPNYVNPETRGDGIVVYSSIFASVATILVCLRLYARIYLIRQPGLDDILIVVGLLFSILMTALVLVQYYSYGVGTHIWDVQPTEGEPGRFISWLNFYCTVISTSATKISILLFYRRLARGSYTKGFLWAVWAGILFNMAYCLGFVLYVTFQCNPIEAYWKQFNPTWSKQFHCVEDGASVPTSIALSVVGDFYATVLPGVLLWNLQIPRKQKMLLYGLFAAGFLVVAAGIFRTYYTYRITNVTYDITWHLWLLGIWTLAEMYFAIIWACIPAIKPFYVKCIPAIKPLYVRCLSPINSAYRLARSRSAPDNSKTHQNIDSSNNSDKPQERSVAMKRFSGLSHANDSQRDRLHVPDGRVEGRGKVQDEEMGITVRSDIEQFEERSRASDESMGVGMGNVMGLPEPGIAGFWRIEVSASQVGKAL